MPQVTLSTTANPCAVTPNAKRNSISIKNLDSTNAVHLRSNSYKAAATVTTGDSEYQLAAGQSISFQLPIHGAAITRGSFQAIASGGTPTIVWSEGYEVR